MFTQLLGEKKNICWGDSLNQRLEDSSHISELCSQLVSETGQDILTIPLVKTEPVLYRICCAVLLFDRIRIQPYPILGHIPYHIVILLTRLVAGAGLEHFDIAV